MPPCRPAPAATSCRTSSTPTHAAAADKPRPGNPSRTEPAKTTPPPPRTPPPTSCGNAQPTAAPCDTPPAPALTPLPTLRGSAPGIPPGPPPAARLPPPDQAHDPPAHTARAGQNSSPWDQARYPGSTGRNSRALPMPSGSWPETPATSSCPSSRYRYATRSATAPPAPPAAANPAAPDAGSSR